MFKRLAPRHSIALSASVLTFALAGCGIGGSLPSQSSQTATSPSAPAAVPGRLVGIAHGGRQPISNGLVTLWAAGTTTGYGQGATYVASTNTSTDGTGTFNLDLPSTSNSQCAIGQLNYITITGGDPGGGVNSSSALLLALPSLCSPAVTGGLSVYVNEITTVASVWSLQQFMTITAYTPPFSGTTPVWNIGAPAANTVGLQNAFAQVASLVNISSAVSASSVVASTVTGGSTPSTFYTIVSPDSQRIYMLADILASCVNTTDNAGDTASIVCSKLFADVVPSAATPPADTIQAAYDIATAPGGITQYPEAAIAGGTVPVGTVLTNPTNSCSGVGCTWALNLCNDFVVPNTPFPLTTSCTQGTASAATYPNDFAIGLRWSAYDNNGRRYGVSHGDAAADSKGNVWTAATTANASSTGNPLVQWDPQGHVLQAVGGSFTMPSSTISAALVNATSSGGAIAGGPYSFSFSSPPSVTLGPATSTAPFTVLGLAVDNSNNAWVSAYAAATVGGASLSSTPSGQTFYPGLLLQVAPATVTTSGTPTASATYASVTAVSGTGSTATITAANSFTTGESIELFGFVTDAAAFNGQTFTVVSATSTSFTISSTVTTTDTGYAIPAITHATSTAGAATPYITGSTPGPIAIDGANNIWVGSRANGTGTYGYTQLLLMTSASNYLNVYQNQSGSSAPYDVMVDGLNNNAWVTRAGCINASM